MMKKRIYEIPEMEAFSFIMETSILGLSVEDKKNDPVGGAEEGDTSDWGWK